MTDARFYAEALEVFAIPDSPARFYAEALEVLALPSPNGQLYSTALEVFLLPAPPDSDPITYLDYVETAGSNTLSNPDPGTISIGYAGTSHLAYGEKAYEQGANIRVKLDLTPDVTLPGDGDALSVLALRVGARDVIRLKVERTAGGPKLQLTHGGVTEDVADLVMGATVALEVRHRADVAAGKLDILMNGDNVKAKSGLANAVDQINRVRFGSDDPGDDLPGSGGTIDEGGVVVDPVYGDEGGGGASGGILLLQRRRRAARRWFLGN